MTVTAKGSSPSGLPLGVALVLGAVTLVVYVSILIAEGNDSILEVAPFLFAMLVAILALVLALAAHGRVRRAAAGVAATLFVLMGVLAIFSIGLLLLVAGGCCLLWLLRSSEAGRG